MIGMGGKGLVTEVQSKNFLSLPTHPRKFWIRIGLHLPRVAQSDYRGGNSLEGMVFTGQPGFVTLYSHVLVNGGGLSLLPGFWGFAPIKGRGAQRYSRCYEPRLGLCCWHYHTKILVGVQHPYESLTVGSRIIGEGTQEVGQFGTERKEGSRRRNDDNWLKRQQLSNF